MNIKEIYVLNRALDGEDIPFMPSFKTLGISDLVASAIKDGMITRGLLESYDEFTEDGLRITDRIRRYKEAEKHVKIDNLLLGIVDEGQSILILWNPLLEEYSVRVVDSTMGAQQVAEGYGFLAEESDAAADSEESLGYDEFTERFTLDLDNSFELSAESGGTVSKEIFFRADGQLYVYDCDAQILYSKSRENILSVLEERMSLS